MLNLVFLLFAYVPHTFVVTDSFDELELNHFFDANGKHVFSQFIGWKYSEDDTLHCHWWILVRSAKGEWKDIGENTKKFVFINKREDKYRLQKYLNGSASLIFKDGLFLRKIKANVYSETYTQYDPELLARKLLSREKRVGVTKPRK